MKKSKTITAQLFLWITFTILVTMLCKIYLGVNPNAPFSQHLPYVVFLELIMGLIFFYTTFFAIPWAGRKKSNLLILAAGLLLLLLIFAYPAINHGFWKVMSSIIPHIMLIFIAIIFPRESKLPKEV